MATCCPRLFSRIIVPDAVWTEIAAGGTGDTAASALPSRTWAQRQAVEPSPRVLNWSLGPGETAVISDALKHPGMRAMLDDRDASRCARTLGVQTLGTGGTLVLAKRRGLLPSVGDALQRLRDAGLWIDEDVVRLLRTKADERLSGHGSAEPVTDTDNG